MQCNIFNFRKEAGLIEGWLTEREGIFLYNMASRVNNKNAIVEIGSWKGKSTICLAHGAKSGGAIVYAIDPHTGSSEHQRVVGYINTFDDFQENLRKAGISKYVQSIRDTSANTAKKFTKPLELIFIDGAHEYYFVKMDYAVWFPKLIEGGLLAFHDSWHFLGPNLVTSNILLTSSQIKNPKLVDTITCFEKVARNSIFDRFNNICFVIYRTIVGVSGFIKLKYHLDGSIYTKQCNRKTDST